MEGERRLIALDASSAETAMQASIETGRSAMPRRFAMLSLLVLFTACGDNVDGGIPEGAHRFDGTEADLPPGDLDPLWALIGGARFIGLGENLHTSGGFYAAKERFIRALIEDHGVRVLAMETPRSPARTLDEYVMSGDCDRPADEVLLPIAKVFSDDNTYGLMRWICERNAATPSDPVRFFGFDIKQGHLDYPEMREFMETWAPDDAPGLLAAIETCHVAIEQPLPTAEGYEACLAGIGEIDAWFSSREADLVATAGERAARQFRIAFTSLFAWQGYVFFYDTDLGRSITSRDIGMGEIFKLQVELEVAPGDRVAIWAHNFHLFGNRDRIEDPSLLGATTFGTVLTGAFGSDYAPVALTAYAPGINWPEFAYARHYDEVGTQPGSVEERLHALREPYLIVDPRAPFLMPQADQVLSDARMVPSEQFAAIVYLDDSPPMDAVYW
jgi:erythromycin esterase-like protein